MRTIKMLRVQIMKQPHLHTERLILRPFKLADSETVKKLAGDFEVSKFTLNIPYPYELNMAKEWISTHEEMWNKKSGLVYAIEKIDDGKLIGTVSLVEINDTNAELGYWIGRPYWSMGYCSEAVQALIQFSISKLGITRIFAEHLASNPASGAVMIKSGLNLLGNIKKSDRNGCLATITTYEARYT